MIWSYGGGNGKTPDPPPSAYYIRTTKPNYHQRTPTKPCRNNIAALPNLRKKVRNYAAFAQ